MLKNNIDTVCFEENCVIKDKVLKILQLPGKGDNVEKGEDIKKNQLAFKKGRK